MIGPTRLIPKLFDIHIHDSIILANIHLNKLLYSLLRCSPWLHSRKRYLSRYLGQLLTITTFLEPNLIEVDTLYKIKY